MQEDKQVFTTYSLKDSLKKKIKSLANEVQSTLEIGTRSNTPSSKQALGEKPKDKDKKSESVIAVASSVQSSKSSGKTKNRKKDSKAKKEKPKRNISTEDDFVSKEFKEKMILIVMGLIIIGIVLFGIIASRKFLRLSVKTPEVKIPQAEEGEAICGGIANISCPSGYYCKLDGNHPDASGICIKGSVLNSY